MSRIEALASELLHEQLGCDVVEEGSATYLGSTDESSYAISLAGLARFVNGVSEVEAQDTFPDVSRAEAAIRLLGISLSAAAAMDRGTTALDDSGHVALGSPELQPTNQLSAEDLTWSEQPGI